MTRPDITRRYACSFSHTDDARNTVINSLNKRFKTGVFQNVSGKEVAGLDLMRFKIFGKVISGEVRIISKRDQKSEP